MNFIDLKNKELVESSLKNYNLTYNVEYDYIRFMNDITINMFLKTTKFIYVYSSNDILSFYILDDTVYFMSSADNNQDIIENIKNILEDISYDLTKLKNVSMQDIISNTDPEKDLDIYPYFLIDQKIYIKE